MTYIFTVIAYVVAGLASIRSKRRVFIALFSEMTIKIRK